MWSENQEQSPKQRNLNESLEFIQRKMYSKDMHHYFSKTTDFLEVINQIFFKNKNGMRTERGSNKFSKAYSLNGIELVKGFDAINELEDYVFLIDE